MALEDTLTLGLIFVNIVLAIALFVIYARSFKAINSKTTLGLLFFSLAFVIENIFNFYFYNSLIVQELLSLTTFNFAVNLLEMIGLIILLWVTWK
ncbi:MAG: hypothetical protein ABIJ92_00625 [Candidatus Aenigmatarchaeota archaeon]